VVEVDARRIQTERTCFCFTSDVLGYLLEEFFVAVQFVTAYIHHETASVRHHIVLCTGVHLSDTHLYRSQQGRNFLEPIVAEPDNVIQHLIYGIVSLLSCGVSGASVGRHVQYHQAFFSHCRLHLSGFAYNGYRDGGQHGQYTLYASLARYLFFARCQIDDVVRLWAQAQLAEYL